MTTLTSRFMSAGGFHYDISCAHVAVCSPTAMKNHVIATPEGTALDEGLVQAYLHTHYRIHPSDTTEGFTLCIGVASEALRALMSHFHRPSAVFITAYNPLGQALSDADNRARHRMLAQELAQRSFPH